MVALVLGGAVGIMLAGLVGWQVGVGAGLVAACAHCAYGYFRQNIETNWRRGARAERRTGRELASLDGRGYTVLHDRAVPDLSSTNLDHLVIGLTGVYAVVTRRVRRGARVWTDEGRLWAGEQPVSGLESTAALAAHLVGKLLTDELDKEMDVEALVAVQSGRVPPEGLEYGGVVFQRGRSLPAFIKSHPVIFTTAQVATITAAAERLFPPMNLGQAPAAS